MARTFTSGGPRLRLPSPSQIAGFLGAIYYVELTRTGGAAVERRSAATGFFPHLELEFAGDLGETSAVGDAAGNALLNRTVVPVGIAPTYVPAEAAVFLAGGEAGVVYSVEVAIQPCQTPPAWVHEIEVLLVGPATISIPRFATHVKALSAFTATITTFGAAENKVIPSSGEAYLGLAAADPTATLAIGGGAGTVNFSFLYRSLPGMITYDTEHLRAPGTPNQSEALEGMFRRARRGLL